MGIPIYQWLKAPDTAIALLHRIPPPPGYVRTGYTENSFASWLRNLPLKPGKPAVRHYDGSKKWKQNGHCAIVNIDVGDRDLQQCADAVMRLRSEYLCEMKKNSQLHFNFTIGDRCSYDDWQKGTCPKVQGSGGDLETNSGTSRFLRKFSRLAGYYF